MLFLGFLWVGFSAEAPAVKERMKELLQKK
jgi:hypothetical protein